MRLPGRLTVYEPGDGRLPRNDGIAVPPVDVGGDAPNGRAFGEAREDAPGVGWPSAARMVGTGGARGQPREPIH